MHQCIIALLFCLLHFAHFLHLYTSIIVSPRLFHPFHTLSFTLILKGVMNCDEDPKIGFLYEVFSIIACLSGNLHENCNYTYWQSQGSYRVLKFAQQFSRPGKNIGKVLRVFFESYKRNFFCAGQILFNLICTFAAHHGNAFFFLHFLKVSICHLFDNLEYGKRNYCFGKSLEKGLAFWIQKSVWTL